MNIVSQKRMLSIHNEHEFLLKLEKAGLNNNLAQLVVESKNNYLANKVVNLIQRCGSEASMSQKLAREIMGKNFLGIEEATQHFGINFSKKQLAQLAEVSFTEAVLRECKDDYILVAGYPLSIMQIREKVDRNLFEDHEEAWYNNVPFAKWKKVNLRWYLIRKDNLPGSRGKTLWDHKLLLGEHDQIPRACDVVYATMLYYLVTGERLLGNLFVRCSDKRIIDSLSIVVGGFTKSGFRVDQASKGSGIVEAPDLRDLIVGIVTEWK